MAVGDRIGSGLGTEVSGEEDSFAPIRFELGGETYWRKQIPKLEDQNSRVERANALNELWAIKFFEQNWQGYKDYCEENGLVPVQAPTLYSQFDLDKDALPGEYHTKHAGETLQNRLKNGESIPVADIINIGAFINYWKTQHNIIFFDIHTGNICKDADGRLTYIDLDSVHINQQDGIYSMNGVQKTGFAMQDRHIPLSAVRSPESLFYLLLSEKKLNRKTIKSLKKSLNDDERIAAGVLGNGGKLSWRNLNKEIRNSRPTSLLFKSHDLFLYLYLVYECLGDDNGFNVFRNDLYLDKISAGKRSDRGTFEDIIKELAAIVNEG